MIFVSQDYDAEDIEESKRVLLQQCDLNRDGRIDKDELSMVLITFARASRVEDSGAEAAATAKWRNLPRHYPPNHPPNPPHYPPSTLHIPLFPLITRLPAERWRSPSQERRVTRCFLLSLSNISSWSRELLHAAVSFPSNHCTSQSSSIVCARPLSVWLLITVDVCFTFNCIYLLLSILLTSISSSPGVEPNCSFLYIPTSPCLSPSIDHEGLLDCDSWFQDDFFEVSRDVCSAAVAFLLNCYVSIFWTSAPDGLCHTAEHALRTVLPQMAPTSLNRKSFCATFL